MSSCIYYKRQGHADKDCWWKPKPVVSKNKFAILADLEQCERCGQDGHNAKRCMTLLPKQEKALNGTMKTSGAVKAEKKEKAIFQSVQKKEYKAKREVANIVEIALKADCNWQ